jgi:hypothetical protein
MLFEVKRRCLEKKAYLHCVIQFPEVLSPKDFGTSSGKNSLSAETGTSATLFPKSATHHDAEPALSICSPHEAILTTFSFSR